MANASLLMYERHGADGISGLDAVRIGYEKAVRLSFNAAASILLDQVKTNDNEEPILALGDDWSVGDACVCRRPGAHRRVSEGVELGGELRHGLSHHAHGWAGVRHRGAAGAAMNQPRVERKLIEFALLQCLYLPSDSQVRLLVVREMQLHSPESRTAMLEYARACKVKLDRVKASAPANAAIIRTTIPFAMESD